MTYKIFDSLLKWTSDNCVSFLEEHYDSVELLPTEEISVKQRIMDRVYKLDDEYHNFEFQTGKIRQKDLRRFFTYHTDLMNKYQSEKIYSHIIYTEKVKKDMICKTEQSTFKPIIFSLKEFNGDKILNKIKTKIKNNEKINKKERFHLGYLATYQTEKQEKEMLLEAAKITNQIKEIHQEDLDNIKNAQLMLVDKYIKDPKEKKKYIGEITMKSESLDMIIEESELRGEARGELKNNFKVTKNMLKADIPISKIMECTGLSKKEIENIK